MTPSDEVSPRIENSLLTALDAANASVAKRERMLDDVAAKIAATESEIERLDRLDKVTLADVAAIENARRDVRSLQADRAEAQAKLDKANVAAVAATRDIARAVYLEKKAQIAALSISLGAYVLQAEDFIRARVEEIRVAVESLRPVPGCGSTTDSAAERGDPWLNGVNVPGTYPDRALSAASLLKWLALRVESAQEYQGPWGGGHNYHPRRGIWDEWLAASTAESDASAVDASAGEVA